MQVHQFSRNIYDTKVACEIGCIGFSCGSVVMLLCNILAPEFMQKSMEDQLRELFRGTSQSGCLPSRDLLQILEKLPSGEPSSFWQSFVLDTSHVDLDELVRDVCEVVDGPKSTELKVWLSFVKLDDKLPTVSSVQRLLYESPEGSAEGADVIALFFTDLFIHRSSIMDLRSLLRRAMGDRAEPYVFNEDDPTLLVRQIPAQLVKATEDGVRHVSMHVAVKRMYVRDFDSDCTITHSDCFPETLALTCKSARKNELEPSFKSVLRQEVLLHIDGSDVDLVLLGANLDTQDDAKLGQLEALERMLKVSKRGSEKFCALMWGDFNNRLVACDDLKLCVKESKKGGNFELLEDGASHLVDSLLDARGRSKLLKMDALTFQGQDVSGRPFHRPKCNSRLKELFHTGTTVKCVEKIPLPSYKHMPLERLLSHSLQHQLRLEELVCVDALQPIDWTHFQEVDELYLGGQKYLVEEGNNLLLPLGWPDAVGIWKGSIPARIERWESEWNLRAFDHLPIRSLVSVKLGGSILKVWLGFIKLHAKMPALDALQQLLFNETCSADGCDVIALYLTEAFMTQEHMPSFQSLLKTCMHTKHTKDYVFNEDDPDLLMKQIPAEMVHCSEAGMNFVSMHVAIKRKHCKLCNSSGAVNFHDCFPCPPSASCKASNSASPKLILRQDVSLMVDGKALDLVLLGADLDTSHLGRLSQVEALERMLKASKQQNICALLWGDLGNSVVAFESLKDHVTSSEGRFFITTSGVKYLMDCLEDPSQRLSLLQKDSLVYSGRDVLGKPYEASLCNLKLKKLFDLSIDAALASGVVPWPSYQVQPFEVMLAEQLGCRVKLLELAVLSRVSGVTVPTSPKAGGNKMLPERERLLPAYFGWTEGGKNVQRKIRVERSEDDTGEIRENYYLQFGWLDGIAWYKQNSVKAELLSWETVQSVQAHDHLPLRALMRVTV